jgi:hypothetical protein
MAIANVTAMCIRCGNAKRYAADRCGKCGFAPRSNSDFAKPFILSAAFDVGDGMVGRSANELSRIADAVSGGKPYEFSDSEVASVERQVAAFRAIGPRHLLVALIRWLGPLLLVIAIAYLLLRSA